MHAVALLEHLSELAGRRETVPAPRRVVSSPRSRIPVSRCSVTVMLSVSPSTSDSGR